MNPKNITPAHSNVYHTVSLKPTNPPTHSDMPITASTAMETFQSDNDDIKEDVQELKNDMQNIHKMLQQLIKPTSTVKKTFRTEPSGLTSPTDGTYGHTGRY
jgi:hypothetical protein